MTSYYEGIPIRKQGLYAYPNPADVARIEIALYNIDMALISIWNSETRSLAETIKDKIVNGIFSGKFMVVPAIGDKAENRSWYEQIKRDSGGGSKALIWTSDMVNSILVHKIEEKGKIEFWGVGIDKRLVGGGRTNPKKKPRAVWKYALGLEENYAAMFEPTWEEAFNNWKRSRDLILKRIGEQWK